MGSEVHAVRKKDGSFLYRVYHTGSDSYITPSLDEFEASLFLLYSWAERGLTGLCVNADKIPEMLELARKNGVSSEKDKRSLDRWNRAPLEYWGNRFVKEKTKEAFLADISRYLNTSLQDHIRRQLLFGEEMLNKREDQEGKEKFRAFKSLVTLLDK